MNTTPVLMQAAFLLLVDYAGAASMARAADPAQQPAAQAAQGLRSNGPDAAAQLTQWYNQTRTNCGTRGRPAFLCSGVMFRGTLSRQSYLPWDPSPGSVTSGGVSFSWIRTDTNFTKLPLHYTNGYIFYPMLLTPAGKNADIQVLCSFPFDGWTDVRQQQGCGAAAGYVSESRPCNEQGINTAEQWLAHYNRISHKYKSQCGWNVRIGQPDSANRFYQSIRAKGLLSREQWTGNNELRLATWKTGTGAQLPIQSFFYIKGTTGLASAQDDQRRYYQHYRQVIPIVEMSLAANKNSRAHFVYRQTDQVVNHREAPTQTIDFETVALQEGATELVLAQARIYVHPADWSRTAKLTVATTDSRSNGISGRYLSIGKSAGKDLIQVVIRPIKPVRRIVMDVVSPTAQPINSSAVSYTDGTGEWIFPRFPGFDWTAPVGKTIKYIQLNDHDQRIDNIRFYE